MEVNRVRHEINYNYANKNKKEVSGIQTKKSVCRKANDIKFICFIKYQRYQKTTYNIEEVNCELTKKWQFTSKVKCDHTAG